MVRAFLGRADDESWVHASDEIITEAVRDEAKRTLGIKATPDRTVITRWQAAMPQYEIGHARRIGEIETLMEAIPRLAITGNYLRGIGIPDCVREGRNAAIGLSDRVSAVEG